MQISRKNAFLGACTALYLGAASIILAVPVRRYVEMNSAIKNAQTELRELNPDIYVKTLKKAGMMRDKKNELLIWEQALKEVRDSQRDAASIASTNYVKAVL